MTELLIIADDFTGALDTGVQFVAHGMTTRVFTEYTGSTSLAPENVRVVVVNVQSRHLPAKEAYNTVFRVAAEAKRIGIPYIYKKTDSALRGNIGSELAAVMDAAEGDKMVFVPAFPQLNRITKYGIHYIDGRPVAESVFGVDPFEPVQHSSVEEILNAQTGKETVVHTDGNTQLREPGIHIFDAQTDADLDVIAQGLKEEELRLSAGCSAFASALAKRLGLQATPVNKITFQDSLLVLCGSKNPLTIKQLDEAENAGYPRIRLTPEQKLSWNQCPQYNLEQTKNWIRMAEEYGLCIIDANDIDADRTDDIARKNGFSGDEIRSKIAFSLGQIAKTLLENGLDSTLLCTGGDTLQALMQAADACELIPVGELDSGVVLTRLEYKGHTYPIISKSGGFGEPDLLCRLLKS